MKRPFILALLFAILGYGFVSAQTSTQAGPTMVAVFPLKNLYDDAKYDELIWNYADSLVSYLNSKPGAGETFSLLPMDEIRDQMLALNVDPQAPAYETEIFKIVKALGAKKVIWGTYLVKYEKSNIDLVIIDAKTLMKDQKNIAQKIRAPFPESLSTVAAAGDKLLPGLP